MARKICLITGSRAEYGHLHWLAKEISVDDRLQLQFLVTGSHLETRFGETWREIEADGFVIDARAPLNETDDSPLGIAVAVGLGVERIARALDNLVPDIIVILGDRYEMLAAASAALVLQIPIAHIHGGETTEGAIDDSIRHAITKIAHLHFAAAAPYARRIVQMGENPQRVFNTGAPGLDALKNLPLLDRDAISRSLDFPLRGPFFLVTYHPVTVANGETTNGINCLLSALDQFPGHKIIFTGVNSDADNQAIASAILNYADANPDRVRYVSSLGHIRYLSAMAIADVVVGNSSSGLIEAPAMKTPTVNIGNRQKGRLASASVIHCPENQKQIVAAIHRACDPEFVDICKKSTSIYGQGDASGDIKNILATTSLDGILSKSFYDQADF